MAKKSEVKNNPQADWNLRSIKGPRKEVIEQIQGALFVPDQWKTALIASIDAMPADVQGVVVDAHCQCVQNLLNITATVSKLY